MSLPPLLDIEHLSVQFGATTVVDDLSFSIGPGEKFALVGESGSGKSITALSILRLVDSATTSGVIRFNGTDLFLTNNIATIGENQSLRRAAVLLMLAAAASTSRTS